MKTRMKKWLSFLLAAVLLIGLVPGWSVTAEAADNNIITGEFRFAPHTVLNTDLVDQYVYSDGFFAGSSYLANPSLATMSMVLTAASISSQDAEIVDQYDQKNRNIVNLLKELGFEDVESEYFKPYTDTMAVTIGHKEIRVNGKTYTLLAVVPRSAGYEREWSGNFNVWGNEDPTLHNGFKLAVDVINAKVKNYVGVYGGSFAQEQKLWTVGYSRGAAVANLFGGLLHGDGMAEELGLNLTKENTYVYTFGTPNNTVNTRQPDPRGEMFGYIHNYFSEYDPITMMPLPAEGWDYTRYGADHLLPTGNAQKKTEMLSRLKRLNEVVYTNYVGGQDPDAFQSMSVALDLVGMSYSILPDPDPQTMKDFLQGRMEILHQLAPTAEGYREEGYQDALCTFMELYHGLNAEESAAFMGTFTGADRYLAIVMLAEMFLAEYAEQYGAQTLLGVLSLGDLSLVAELLLSMDESLSEETTEAIVKKMDELITEDISGYTVDTLVQVLRGAAAKNMTFLMSEAMTAAGITGSAKDNIYNKLMNGGNMAALVDLFGALLFRVNLTAEEETALEEADREDAADPLWKSLFVDMLSTAVTVLKNSGSYMRVHNNEVLISWLRTSDPYYHNNRPAVPVVPDSSYEAPDALEHFRDLSEGWYEDGIRYCLEKGLMDGVGNRCFDPNGTMTRAMTVTVLWRLSDYPAAATTASFKDVAADSWYAVPVAWAKESGYVTGVSGKKFAPDLSVTREQLAAMLWRHAGSPSAEGDLSGFADAEQVSAYAEEAMTWAVEQNIIKGIDGHLEARGNATRAQFAQMVKRYMVG